MSGLKDHLFDVGYTPTAMTKGFLQGMTLTPLGIPERDENSIAPYQGFDNGGLVSRMLVYPLFRSALQNRLSCKNVENTDFLL